MMENDIPVITNQLELLHEFNDRTRPQFNNELFERSDDDLIQAVENVILSCQRDKYFTIRVDKFTVVKEKEEVDKIMYAKKQAFHKAQGDAGHGH